jgi:hypothetical protein
LLLFLMRPLRENMIQMTGKSHLDKHCINGSQIRIDWSFFSLQTQINCNLLYTVSPVLGRDILKLSEDQKFILKFCNSNSFLPIHILFFCFIGVVNIFIIPIYLLNSMKYVPYSFNFLFGVEETLCCEAKGITAPIHITRNAPEIVQVTLNTYIVGDNYCNMQILWRT